MWIGQVRLEFGWDQAECDLDLDGIRQAGGGDLVGARSDSCSTMRDMRGLNANMREWNRIKRKLAAGMRECYGIMRG